MRHFTRFLLVVPLLFLFYCSPDGDTYKDGTLDITITINQANQQAIFRTVRVSIDGAFKETLSFNPPQSRIVYTEQFYGQASDFKNQRAYEFQFVSLTQQNLTISCDYTYILTCAGKVVSTQTQNKSGTIIDNSVLDVFFDVANYFN